MFLHLQEIYVLFISKTIRRFGVPEFLCNLRPNKAPADLETLISIRDLDERLHVGFCFPFISEVLLSYLNVIRTNAPK